MTKFINTAIIVMEIIRLFFLIKFGIKSNGKNLMKLQADKAEKKININNLMSLFIPTISKLIFANASTEKATWILEFI